MIGFVRRTVGFSTVLMTLISTMFAYVVVTIDPQTANLFSRSIMSGGLIWVIYAALIVLSVFPWQHEDNKLASEWQSFLIKSLFLGGFCALASGMILTAPNPVIDRRALSDWLAWAAWAVLFVLIVLKIFSFRLRPGNYIINGVVKKEGKSFWVTPGAKVEVLPEFIEVSGSGICEGGLRCTVSGRRAYAVCFDTGEPIDVGADREAFLACLVESMQKFRTVDTYHKRFDFEFQRSVRTRFYPTDLHWTLEPLR